VDAEKLIQANPKTESVGVNHVGTAMTTLTLGYTNR